MSRLPSSRETLRALERAGFEQVSQKGSHVKLRLLIGQGVRTVIVPHPRRELSAGTFGSILKQAGLSLLEFEDLL
ncbi:MAG: addiction module toxin, HicA family [Anaerolinea sp.]|nr:addiction module toxin, HicA family [Anaerolinea sp.]